MVATIAFHFTIPALVEPQRSAARYRAIMDAAAHIEAHPHLYSYDEIRMDDSTPRRCILGRIGTLYGGHYANADQVAPALLGMNPSAFFWEIGALILHRTPNFNSDPDDYHVLFHAKKVAPALRQFAERYRPAEVLPLPACVTEIFAEGESHAVV